MSNIQPVSNLYDNTLFINNYNPELIISTYVEIIKKLINYIYSI